MATPADTPPTPTAPVCAGCGDPAAVNWQRRLTDDELDAHVALEQEKRDGRLLLADPQLTPPDFGPLSTAADCTRPVYACGPHAISMDLAALIHEAACGAPFVGRTGATLYGCDCTPEPMPVAVADPEPEPSRLPEHWITGGG